ncbi:MAG: hypothetical protein HFE65_05610 [Clostridiales bacterium]|nr:hypothetical protein [Clostridiales bacterium]
MRKLLIVLLCIFAITLIGCHTTDPLQRDSDSITDVSSAEDVPNTKSESSKPESSSESAESAIPSEPETISVPEAESKPEKSTPPSQNISSNTPISRPEEKPPEVATPINPEQDLPKPSSTPESKPQETTSPAEPVPPKEPDAGASDSQAVADAVLAYINRYHAEQESSAAVKLSGLTGYAEYRSRQLISNFAHDTEDERAAATALKYGEYIDPALYGMTGKPYYTVNAREAIAKGGYSGTIDEVARSLARLVRNSSNHWSYVGSAEYGYIGVGVTYESGMWYCDIAVARENTD